MAALGTTHREETALKMQRQLSCCHTTAPGMGWHSGSQPFATPRGPCIPPCLPCCPRSPPAFLMWLPVLSSEFIKETDMERKLLRSWIINTVRHSRNCISQLSPAVLSSVTWIHPLHHYALGGMSDCSKQLSNLLNTVI